MNFKWQSLFCDLNVITFLINRRLFCKWVKKYMTFTCSAWLIHILLSSLNYILMPNFVYSLKINLINIAYYIANLDIFFCFITVINLAIEVVDLYSLNKLWRHFVCTLH